MRCAPDEEVLISASTWPNPATAAYRDLLGELDAWFADAVARHPEVVPCRAGCSACCHGPFDISVADAALMRDALVRLSESERAEVEHAAARQVQRMQELEPAWDMRLGLGAISEEAFDRLSEVMAGEPCVFLDSAGACRIYQSRPLVCRMIGLGMVTPAGRVIENECPIQSDFPDYAHLPPQPLDLESLEEREDACLEAASVQIFGTPEQVGFETTIAAVVVSVTSPPTPSP